MRAIYLLALAAALAACATHPPAASSPGSAAGSPAADESMGIEARLVLRRIPNPPSPQTASLKARYPNREAFLADLQTVRPTAAVELDGKQIASGFGPPLRYRTADDGSIGSQSASN